jgi:hypothetical protein
VLSQAGLGNIAQNMVVGLKPEHFPYLAHHRETAQVKWNIDEERV